MCDPTVGLAWTANSGTQLGSLLGCSPFLSFGKVSQGHPSPSFTISRATQVWNIVAMAIGLGA